MNEYSLMELDRQDAELLPAREALQTANATITAYNVSLALPDASGNAWAGASQTVVVVQGPH